MVHLKSMASWSSAIEGKQGIVADSAWQTLLFAFDILLVKIDFFERAVEGSSKFLGRGGAGAVDAAALLNRTDARSGALFIFTCEILHNSSRIGCEKRVEALKFNIDQNYGLELILKGRSCGNSGDSSHVVNCYGAYGLVRLRRVFN